MKWPLISFAYSYVQGFVSFKSMCSTSAVVKMQRTLDRSKACLCTELTDLSFLASLSVGWLCLRLMPGAGSEGWGPGSVENHIDKGLKNTQPHLQRHSASSTGFKKKIMAMPEDKK